MASHNEFGKQGELSARKYLIDNGYIIRHVNWRSRKNELDIVAEKGNIVVFVEVKTRSYDAYGLPEDFVNKSKMKRTISAAADYYSYFNLEKEKLEPRFDIISVLGADAAHFTIEHIEDAFTAYRLYG